MIRIIKRGVDAECVTHCPICGCDFAYNLSNVSYDTKYVGHVPCPTCFYPVTHIQEATAVIQKTSKQFTCYENCGSCEICKTHKPDCNTCPAYPEVYKH